VPLANGFTVASSPQCGLCLFYPDPLISRSLDLAQSQGC
jgi:hypothetical protein